MPNGRRSCGEGFQDSQEVELEADKREVKVNEGKSEVKERAEDMDVTAAESVADVESVEYTEEADTGSTEDMAVGVADSEDDAVVVPASVIVAPA